MRAEHDHKTQAQDFIADVVYELDKGDGPVPKAYTDALVNKLEEMSSDDLMIQWHKFDENDPKTWPQDMHGRNTVLGFRVWSKGSHHRYGSMSGDVKETREARFFEAVYGRFDIATVDGEQKVVFFLDHGNEDVEDSDDWVEPPTYWTYIADPQRLELD